MISARVRRALLGVFAALFVALGIAMVSVTPEVGAVESNQNMVVVIPSTTTTIPANYTLLFDANGGSGAMSSLVVKSGTATALTANAFTRTGYTFSGWATSSTGSVAYANSATLTPTSNLTLYAVWTAVTYTVTFNANGGAGTMAAMTFTVTGRSLTANTLTRAGYTFAGWATTASGTVAFADSATYSTAGNMTLYAVWTAVSYAVTFNANGGSGTMANQTFTVAGASLTANAFTRTGYTFAGWATTASGTVAFADSATYSTAGNVTLYAVWTAVNYTVTFNANGGSGTMSAMAFTVTGKALTANAFTRTSYTFAGWATTATGTVAFANSANYNTAGNVTLYAVWTPVDYSITFNANGGTGTMANQIFTVVGEPLDANAFTRTGYTFAGWATTATGTVAFANSANYNTAGNVTLYAVWTAVNYTVTFNANGGTGTMANQTFTVAGAALTKNTLTRTGYTFAGWATTASGTVAFADSATYSTAGNVTLYAVWTPINYAITFNANGGTGTMANQTFTVTGAALTKSTFTRTGYTFAGWSTTATGTVAFTDSATYNAAGNVTLFAVWTAVNYAITFNANGGTGTMANQTFTVAGAALTANAFTRTGYTFAGWSTTATGTVAFANSANYSAAGNVTLFAVWTAVNYAITFNANGGTGTMANQTFTVAGAALTKNTLTRTGYTFAGWATTASGTVAFADSATYSTAGNVTLYAVWTAVNYTVTFNANGGTGTMANQTFTVAGAALTKNTLTRTGYTFAGWATTASGTVAFADSATYNTAGNVTLYAVWTAVNYTVTFNANGGTGTMANQTFTVAGAALTKNTFTRTGYTFAGWSSTAAGSVTFADAATYNTAGNVTLYAVWTAVNYTITFNANGGTGTMANQVFTVVGEPLNANTLTRTGYTFAGWSTTATGTVAFANSANYNTAGNVTLYAVWTAVNYTVTFNANGGTGTMANQTFTVAGAALTKNTLTRTGYTFAGWSSTAAGSVAFADSATYNTAGNVTLYAVWTAVNYTVTFNANGGAGTMSAMTFTVAGKALTANAFTRTGYTFAGWSTTATGTVAFANNANYNTAGNVTLYAVWTAVNYTVTFNANGGTGTMANQTFTVAGAALTKNTLTRAGYTFSGWATTATGSVAFADAATYNTAGNVTLYAVWTPVTYTVTFNANGGTGTMAAMTFTVTGRALTKNTFTRTGKTFGGWATTAAGTTVAYADMATINTAGNITLYAIWK